MYLTIKLNKMTTFKIGDSVSFTEDYTHQFDVFEVEAINLDGTLIIHELQGCFDPNLFTIVHTY